ncbi:MAG: amidohydrolase family protein [Clostridia bacterium]|nr:amidohydrolase family protein [Clostridia bacterium]
MVEPILRPILDREDEPDRLPWADYRIFDMHTHVYPDAIAPKAVGALNQFYSFTAKCSGTVEGLFQSCRDADVYGFALLGVATNPQQVEHVNAAVLRNASAARTEGFRAVAFIGMHQDYPHMEAEIERAKLLGAKGVKIHPDIQKVDIDDPRLCKLYALLSEADLPVYFHMGDHRADYRYSSPDKLVKVARAFPKVRFIAAHLGAYRAWDESDQLIGLPNVWFDTSSVLWSLPTPRALELIRSFGVDRIFFGTDYPVTTASEELTRFFRLPLLEEERRAILWENAVRFLNLT